MKKILFKILIVLFSIFILVSCDNLTPIIPEDPNEQKNNDPDEFNENKIVMSFLAISDTHQATEGSKEKLKSIIKFAENQAGGFLNAIIISGDLTNSTDRNPAARPKEILMFKSAFEESINLEETAVFYSLGNHDNDPHQNMKTNGIDWETSVAEMDAIPRMYYEELGPEFFRFDEIDLEQMYNGNRYMNLNGFDFIAINAVRYDSRELFYTKETLYWLEEKLFEITLENNKKPIFVVTHMPLYDYMIGGGLYSGTDTLKNVLDNFPQIIHISGHFHSTLQNEFNIQQHNFTTITPGAVYNSLIDRAPDSRLYHNSVDILFDNTSEKTDGVSNMVTANGRTLSIRTMKYNATQGILMEIDENNNMRLTRLDARLQEVIGEPWILKSPKKDGSHLLDYTNEKRIENSIPPRFYADSTLNIRYLGNNIGIVNIPPTTGEQMVFYFILEVLEDGSEIQKKYLSSYADMYANSEDMKDNIPYMLNVLQVGRTYTIKVYPVNNFGKIGDPIITEITPEF